MKKFYSGKRLILLLPVTLVHLLQMHKHQLLTYTSGVCDGVIANFNSNDNGV